MTDFNGPAQEISFICYTIDISIATMGGLEDTWIGCLAHLLQTRKNYQQFGEEISSINKIEYYRINTFTKCFI